MTDPEVTIDERLVEAAAAVAQTRGETIEFVIDRALRAYIAQKDAEA